MAGMAEGAETLPVAGMEGMYPSSFGPAVAQISGARPPTQSLGHRYWLTLVPRAAPDLAVPVVAPKEAKAGFSGSPGAAPATPVQRVTKRAQVRMAQRC